MADLAENLRTFLLTDASISTAVGASRISQTHVPQEFSGSFIWLTRSSVSHEEDSLSDGPGTAAFRQYFDLECVATSIDSADSLGDLVEAKLHLATGTVGTQTVQRIWCMAQNDDYIPRTIEADDGLYVRSFSVEVVP